MLKKISIFVISITVIFNNFLSVIAVGTTNYYDASEKLQHANIIIARPVENPFEDTFDIAQVTRAEFSLVILNALRIDVPPIAENSYFQDCDIKDWYTPYINTLFDLKIVSGYGNDNFKPKSIVTNYEAITILVRCLGYEKIKTENETYPHKYLEIAEQLNLFENTSINRFLDEPITNGNMFVLLVNAMRCNINDSAQRLWDFGVEKGVYDKVYGIVTSVDDSGFVLENDTEIIRMEWGYEEDTLPYLNKNVAVWYEKEGTKHVVDIIPE